MHLLQRRCATSQLAPLLLWLSLLLLNALCAATEPSLDGVHIATSIGKAEQSTPPSAQLFPTQFATTNNNNRSSLNNITTTTPPPSPSYTFRLLDFHAILTSPTTETNLGTALDRVCEVFAYSLLDLDLLEAQNIVLRFGDFTLDFYEVGEYLSTLAMKAALWNLVHLMAEGLRGFLKGEIFDLQAEVRMIFTFGILGGPYQNWE